MILSKRYFFIFGALYKALPWFSSIKELKLSLCRTYMTTSCAFFLHVSFKLIKVSLYFSNSKMHLIDVLASWNSTKGRKKTPDSNTIFKIEISRSTKAHEVNGNWLFLGNMIAKRTFYNVFSGSVICGQEVMQEQKVKKNLIQLTTDLT